MTLPENFNEEFKQLEQKLAEAQAHELREQKFAIEANERFSKNLAAFEQYYPDVFKAIQEFQPREDFCLHVTKSGHGNFVPKGKEAPLYGEDPYQQVNRQVNAALTNPTIAKTEYTKVDLLNFDERLHIQYMQKLVEYIRKIGLYEQSDSLSEIKGSFPSAMIFGLGLGYAVESLIERVEFSYIFIIEPDFEVFFASLFCIDWSKLIQRIDDEKGCLFLLLGASEQELAEDLSTIAEDIGAFCIVNSFCFQHYQDDKLSKLAQNFYSNYFRFQFGFGFYNDAITGFAHSLIHAQNNENFFNQDLGKIKRNGTNPPVFIIGNGPSLDDSIEYIKRNQDKAIIFACGTALGSLVKAGVNADFHVLVERPLRNYEALLDMLTVEEYKKVNLLSVNTVYPDTVDLYKWSGLALKGNEAGSDYINLQHYVKNEKGLPFIPHSNPLVANTALSFALSFGFKDIYLFGVDNGSVNEGLIHSQLSVYNDLHKGKFDYEELDLDSDSVIGNFNKLIKTNSTFKMSNNQLELLISLFPKCDVKNVGDGLSINGATPVHSDELIELGYSVNKIEEVDFVKGLFSQINIPSNSHVERIKTVFDEIISHLISIASESVLTVKEAADNLMRQSRYIYSYKDTVNRFYFNILKGSLLYFHTPMQSVLYSLNEEENNIEIYNGLNKIWLSYLSDIRSDFPVSCNKKCDWSFASKSPTLLKQGNPLKVLQVYSSAYTAVDVLYQYLSKLDSSFKFVGRNLVDEPVASRKLVKSFSSSECIEAYTADPLISELGFQKNDIIIFNNLLSDFIGNEKGVVFIRNPVLMYAEMKKYYINSKDLELEITSKLMSMVKAFKDKKFRSIISSGQSALANFCSYYNYKFNLTLKSMVVIKFEDFILSPSIINTEIANLLDEDIVKTAEEEIVSLNSYIENDKLLLKYITNEERAEIEANCHELLNLYGY
ncbi:DUF115 domain-containing protein [Pseudoalteromonas sp. APAL1]|uniref:motility associated factor glycosyltransferase family protein n=1 Tax=Pseudoalteromonas sp. APAL1 TaxID=2908883 RepID=UPI001F48372A|nr:6-hydroxymethylpterin diphosphokinase MptE-like protein [Pseudoalteromonas sp. APAL1]MCF2918992.1 DUF115 domain-containing protein [Pseudoalteromonas sp. APAL1]